MKASQGFSGVLNPNMQLKNHFNCNKSRFSLNFFHQIPSPKSQKNSIIENSSDYLSNFHLHTLDLHTLESHEPCFFGSVEYNVSYIYHVLFAYFDRDNVALPGFAKFFKDSSDDERDDAEKLMKYQNIRGGKVKLQSILMPALMEFENAQKGDALYAMELTLSLEKLTNQKLLNLHAVAQEANDGQMTDFIEGNFLTPQVETIKKVSEYVSQLRRIGKGHAVWHFDQMLQNGGDVAAAPDAGALAA